jgi:hypothetical protein
LRETDDDNNDTGLVDAKRRRDDDDDEDANVGDIVDFVKVVVAVVVVVVIVIGITDEISRRLPVFAALSSASLSSAACDMKTPASSEF